MSGSANFTWIGQSGGDWNTASNWADVTTGQTPAMVAPGSLDVVTVPTSTTISGTGNATNLTFLGNDSITGSINAGTVILSGAASLGAIDGGTVQAGTFNMGSNRADDIYTDQTSTIEIGTAGSATAGAITVDPGGTLSGAGTVGASVIDNGLIIGTDLTLGPAPDIGYGGLPGLGWLIIEMTTTLSGSGTIAVRPAGTITLEQPVATSGLTLQLDGAATLDMEAAIAAGNAIDLSGDANTLAIDPQWYVTEFNGHWSGGPPAVAATINGFNSSDSLIFVDDFYNGLSITSAGYSDGVLSLLNGSAIVSTYSLTGDFSGDTFLVGAATPSPLAAYQTQQAITIASPVGSTLCFLPGALISTPHGEVPIERLGVGNAVCTWSGATRRIVWIGTGTVLATRGRRSAATPVVVRKGAFADNVPHSDLRVTRGHSFFLEQVLIPVEFLVNHRSILWDDRAQEVTLYHLELDTHDVLIANGAPAESYRDDGNRWLFQNANSGWDLPPQEPYAPVLTGGPVVDAMWRRLLDRAGPRPALPLTDNADLHLVADGQRLDAIERVARVHVFHLSVLPSSLNLVSRAAAPAELGLARDPRVLGVALRRLVVRKGSRFRVTEAEDGRLADGFHAFEEDNGFRWTDGDAAIPAELFDGFTAPLELVAHVAATTRYVDDSGVRRVS